MTKKIREKRKRWRRTTENQGNNPKEVFEEEESIQEGRVGKDADQENLGSCYRSQKEVQTAERKNLSII